MSNIQNEYAEAVDVVWLSICAFVIFFMQLGFGFLEAGAVRYKNLVSILIKNLMNMAFATIMWWFLGYGFAFGKDKGLFIGNSKFAGEDIHGIEYAHWLFQWAVALTTATITSGCAAERMTIMGYTYFTMFFLAWVYPVYIHWTWGQGWLHHQGYHDLAGSAMVHMGGGLSTMIMSIMLGPRKGRFDPEFKPNNIPLIIFGCMLLWFCWYAFNAGSTLAAVGQVETIGIASINTTLSAAAGSATTFTIHFFRNRQVPQRFSAVQLCNGLLAGLVAITGVCDYATSYGAFIIGIIAGIIYVAAATLMEHMHIDDPLDAVPIHAFCGMWGCSAVGWFHKKRGIFYGGGATLWGIQLMATVSIAAWAMAWTFVFMLILKKLELLRLKEHYDFKGFDTTICDVTVPEGSDPIGQAATNNFRPSLTSGVTLRPPEHYHMVTDNQVMKTESKDDIIEKSASKDDFNAINIELNKKDEKIEKREEVLKVP